MDWFRWYHGACSDPKWPIVARKAGVNVGVVVSVWAALLEHASQNEERGNVSEFDCETIDALYGYEDGVCEAVLAAMIEKGMICDGRICAWSKRQPKREDDMTAERKRRQRSREQSEKDENDTATAAEHDVTDMSRDVTHMSRTCHAMSRDVTHMSRDVTTEKRREEERREEKKEETTPVGVVVGADAPPPCPHVKILEAYHALLPELPSVKVWEGARKQHLQARWRERWKAQKYRTLPKGIAYWERLFRHVHENCDWLMGRITGRDGKAFKADLAWIVRPENFAKLIEGKYDNRTEA